jgi:hypothetical protein
VTAGVYSPANHEYRIGTMIVESCTEPLKGLGLYKGSDFFTDEARDRGTRLHRAIEAWLKDSFVPEMEDADITPRFEAVKRFLLTVVGTTPFAVERSVYNDKIMAAGTPDFVGPLHAIGGDEVVLDWKSGAIDPVVGLQLAGYNVIEGKLWRPRYALQARADGTYKLHRFTEPGDHNEWISALNLYRKYKKGVRRVAA